MKLDVSKEILFKTARSGGKGGQNVNKVETMVEGYFNIAGSQLLTADQKMIIAEKLVNKINGEGFLQIRSQVHRSQLENKEEVIKKMNALLSQTLIKRKKRIATRPSAVSKEKRIDSKKKNAQIKESRKKLRSFDL
ncbi:MAG: aminoacyl-tRNA hydrolase [Bacteroidetes bacterium]|nr:MAG: aminoacyl-tRNA hydrolase [Bacteroidota bacterium]